MSSTILEPQRDLQMVTVRVPRELHERLRHASRTSRLSMNTLCIEALTRLLDSMGAEQAQECVEAFGGLAKDMEGSNAHV